MCPSTPANSVVLLCLGIYPPPSRGGSIGELYEQNPRGALKGYTVNYRYRVDEIVHWGSIRVSIQEGRGTKIGDETKLLYDQDQPEHSLPRKHDSVWSYVPNLGKPLFISVFILPGLLEQRQKEQHRQTLAIRGKRRVGQVTETEFWEDCEGRDTILLSFSYPGPKGETMTGSIELNASGRTPEVGDQLHLLTVSGLKTVGLL